MRILALVTPILLAGSFAHAARIAQTTQKIIRLCLDTGAIAPSVLAPALGITNEVFSRIGIDLKWRSCGASAEDAVVLRITGHTPESLLPGALGYTRLDGSPRIEVFYDRILTAVDSARLRSLLGNVMAHEIAHALQGVNHHSSGGLMKAHWTTKDYEQMSWSALPFAPEDIQLIARGVTKGK